MAKALPLPVVQSGLESSIDQVRKNIKPINVPVNVDPSAFKNLAQPLGRVSGLATEFEKSIAASNARVLAFGASVGIINGVQNAFASLLQTGIQVQKTLAEIAAISGQSGGALAKFGDSLFEVAKLTGQSFKTAAQAALEFSRQGLTSEETLKRTTDALTLTRFTTLNAAEAVDVLTAAANSFGDTGITTTQILNKLVAVDSKFAVSAEDLANGLARAGSIAQEVGVSFDELNAAVAVAQERTARGGSVIGNALKTIFTRLRSDETVLALRAIGVESLNAQGELKGAIPLLQELSQKLEGLSGGERVQILEAVASKYNINILSALLNDLNNANSKFAQAVGVSSGASNQAYERQIELNKALAIQINKAEVSVTQLFNKLSEIGVTESLSNLLSFVNDLINGFNKILDSESTGGNIAKGLIKGISDVFFTVGLPLLGAIFIKLTKDIAQFGVESLKTILGINQQVRERQALEQAVVNTLIRDQEIMATILSLSGNRAKQEEYLLSVYNKQLAALQQVQSIAAGVAPALQAAGLSATSGTVKRRAAEGYLPAAEAKDVRRGVGGASPSSKVVEIPNFSFGGGKRGTMVANTSEYIVRNYGGGSGTAIFNQDMAKEYGLPPGAKKITASGGFVPASGFVPNFEKSSLMGIGGFKANQVPIYASASKFTSSKASTGYIPNFTISTPEQLEAYKNFPAAPFPKRDEEGKQVRPYRSGFWVDKERGVRITTDIAKNALTPQQQASLIWIGAGEVDNVKIVSAMPSDGSIGAAMLVPDPEMATNVNAKSMVGGTKTKTKEAKDVAGFVKFRAFGFGGSRVKNQMNKMAEKDVGLVKNIRESMQAAIEKEAIRVSALLKPYTFAVPDAAGFTEKFKKQPGAAGAVGAAAGAVFEAAMDYAFVTKKSKASQEAIKASAGKTYDVLNFKQSRILQAAFGLDADSKKDGVEQYADFKISAQRDDEFADQVILNRTFVDYAESIKRFREQAAAKSKASEGYIPNYNDPSASLAIQKISDSTLQGKLDTAAEKAYGGFTEKRPIKAGVSKRFAAGTQNTPATLKFREALEKKGAGLEPLLNRPYGFMGLQLSTAPAGATFSISDPESVRKFNNPFPSEPEASRKPALVAVANYREPTRDEIKKGIKPDVVAPQGQYANVSYATMFGAPVQLPALGVKSPAKKASFGYVPNFADLFVDYDHTIFTEQLGKVDEFNNQRALIKEVTEEEAKGMTKEELNARKEVRSAAVKKQKDLLTPFGRKLLESGKPFKLVTSRWNDYKTGITSSLLGLGFKIRGEEDVFALGREFSEENYKIDNPKFAEEMKKPEGERNKRIKPKIEPLAPQKKALFFKERAPQMATGDIDFVDNDVLNLQAVKSLMPKINTFTPDQYMAKLLAPQQVKGAKASLGYVPNFADNDPLKEAIGREVAAGVPPARVRVTQDKRLKNRDNPDGLAVINTRDEPNGKIPNNFRKRAAVQQVASKGFMPNFAERYPKGTVIDGKKVGGQFVPKKELDSLNKNESKSDEIIKTEEKQLLSTNKLLFAFGTLTLVTNQLESNFRNANSGLAAFSTDLSKGLQAGAAYGSVGSILGETGIAKGLLGAGARFLGPAGLIGGSVFGMMQSSIERSRQNIINQKAEEDKTVEDRYKEVTKSPDLTTQQRFDSQRKIIEDLRREIDRKEYEKSRTSTAPEIAAYNDAARDKEEQEILELRKRLNVEYRVSTRLFKDLVDQRSAERRQEEQAIKAAQTRLSISSKIIEIDQAFNQRQRTAQLGRAKYDVTALAASDQQTENERMIAELNNKNLEFNEKIQDAKAQTTNRALSILASASANATVTKETYEIFVKQVKEGKKLETIQQTLAVLGTEGAIAAAEELKKVIAAGEETEKDLELQKKIFNLFGAINIELANRKRLLQVINKSSEENFNIQNQIKDVEEEAAFQRKRFETNLPTSALERRISRQPFATREQTLALSIAKDARNIKLEELSLEKDRAFAIRNADTKYKQGLISRVRGLTYLRDEEQESIVRRIREAESAKEAVQIALKAEEEISQQRKITDKDNQQIRANFMQGVIAEGSLRRATEEQITQEYERQLGFIDRIESRQTALNRLSAESPFLSGVGKAIENIEERSYAFKEILGYETTNAFRDGLKDAMSAAISQTDDLNIALQNVAVSFLQKLQDALLNDAADNLTLAIKQGLSKGFSGVGEGSGGSIFSSIGSSILKFFTSGPDTPRAAMVAKGGYIKGYESGGLVTGGSGYKDDVPAMLSAGEYVIRKSSVEKYGASNLQKLNSGEPPKFASGGIFLPGVRGGTAISGYKDLTAFAKQTTTSGATDVLMGGRSTAFANLEDQSQRLSAYALLNEDDIINQEIRSAQEQGLNIIKEREAYRTAQRKAFQQGLKKTAISALLTFGISRLVNNPSVKLPKGVKGASWQGATNPKIGMTAAYGGLIQRYANGGTPTDKIPALVMDGEYIMSEKATRKYGKNFFDSINQGRAPRFANGGQVSSSEPSFAEKAAAATESKSSGTNVSININVTGGTADSQTQGDTKQDGKDYKKMAEQIKQIVLQTINEEKRLGGSLRPRG